MRWAVLGLGLALLGGCAEESDVESYRFSPGRGGRGGRRGGAGAPLVVSPAPGFPAPRTTFSPVETGPRVGTSPYPRFTGVGSLPEERTFKNAVASPALVALGNLSLGAVGARRASSVCLQVEGNLTLDGAGRVVNGRVFFGDQMCPTLDEKMAVVRYHFSATPVATPAVPNVSRSLDWAIVEGGERIGTIVQIPQLVNAGGRMIRSFRYEVTELCNGPYAAKCAAVLR